MISARHMMPVLRIHMYAISYAYILFKLTLKYVKPLTFDTSPPSQIPTVFEQIFLAQLGRTWQVLLRLVSFSFMNYLASSDIYPLM